MRTARMDSGLLITVENPVPQMPPGGSSPRDNPVLLDVSEMNEFSTASDKLVVIMVGLPARGKLISCPGAPLLLAAYAPTNPCRQDLHCPQAAPLFGILSRCKREDIQYGGATRPTNDVNTPFFFCVA